jgi:hypothetical protein
MAVFHCGVHVNVYQSKAREAHFLNDTALGGDSLHGNSEGSYDSSDKISDECFASDVSQGTAKQVKGRVAPDAWNTNSSTPNHIGGCDRADAAALKVERKLGSGLAVFHGPGEPGHSGLAAGNA